MHTSVKRTILDKSISGDKIFGGSIDFVNSIYTDELYIPHVGTSGIGAINGSAFQIGTTEHIGALFAQTIKSFQTLGLSDNSELFSSL